MVPHGLDLSIGSAEGIDEAYLEKFSELVDFVEPEWFSDHICFTKSGGTSIGHLAPVPYTFEALKVLIENVNFVKKENQHAFYFRKHNLYGSLSFVRNDRGRIHYKTYRRN